jgi:hypothetical protein
MGEGPTRAVLEEVARERVHQIEDRGWTPEHDDTHTTQEWAWLLSQRAVALSCPWPDAVFDARRQLVEIAAIATAAIESLDRKTGHQLHQPPG